ncbi:Der1-like family-domain-containing protein [Exophiala viscosa]|uniref:Derlin n=1 Tax=Exophiala viscosa TaxID=2486360 RepID=A0AAN6IC07_9EURO|nr:Der1-like family-domain-containing protein [Exophiala viscosa]KAI1623224.1 Der1-like family-domain-containing protein [Exophiala viscosa]
MSGGGVDIMDRFWSAPPVSRTIVAAMFVESALVHSGLVNGMRVVFYTPSIFKFPPELWRILSSFLLTGGGLSFLFDLYFMFTYASGLELTSSRFSQPGDFFTYVLFLATVILVVGGFILKSMVFTQALLLGFIYTYAQDNRGKKAHFIIVQIPVEILPWATLVFSLVMGGPQAALQQGVGLVAAHLYDFLTRLYPTFQGGRNYIQTPAAIKRYFGANRSAFTNKGYGTSFRPGQPEPQQQSRGWTSGFSGAWGGRGAGRRLGGD